MFKIVRKKIIYGCEVTRTANVPYLSRWVLFEKPWGALYLHWFHRSDSRIMHDHPWGFWSLLLWRGYIEETPLEGAEGRTRRRRYWPGALLRRPPEWAHRVELIREKPALTLVFVGKRVRKWGFWTARGWTDAFQYFAENGCVTEQEVAAHGGV